jgi:hypothetical protein
MVALSGRSVIAAVAAPAHAGLAAARMVDPFRAPASDATAIRAGCAGRAAVEGVASPEQRT